MKQKLAIARAMLHGPRVIFLDEPAGGLGAADLEELAELVRGFKGERTVLLVEHHMDFVMALCDRVVVLDFGKLIAAGEPAAVQEDQRVIDAYLGVEAGAAS